MMTPQETQKGELSATDISGVQAASWVFFTAMVVWALPYVVPGLDAYRAWTPAEPVPFVRLFKAGHEGPAVAEVGGGVSARTTLSAAERQLLAASSAGAPPARGGVEPARASRPEAKRVAPLVAPKEVMGVKVALVDPSNAMRAFYEALSRTARGEKGAITRIAHWGDSATAPDKVTAITRVLLQKRFGDAGHGFMLASAPTRWYRIAGVRRRQEGWKHKRVTHGNARNGRYGYGGVRAVGKKGAFTDLALSRTRSIGNRVGRFDILFARGPRYGKLAVLIDGKRRALLSTRAPAWRDAVHSIRVSDATHRISLRPVGGEVNVYGVVLEREVKGVIYENLGLIGHTAKRLLWIDQEHFKAQLALRRPDLMILMMGGNELSRRLWTPERYAKTFSRSLRRFKSSRPQASCLVISPLDHGEKVNGRVRTRPRLPKLIAVQRRVAKAEGCAFYDVFAAMGGERTMARWAKARPRLVLPDYAHLSRDGARIVGGLIYKALLHGFARYRAVSGAR